MDIKNLDGTECDPETAHLIIDDIRLETASRIGYLMLQFESLLDEIGLGATYKSWSEKERFEAKVKTHMDFGVDLKYMDGFSAYLKGQK